MGTVIGISGIVIGFIVVTFQVTHSGSLLDIPKLTGTIEGVNGGIKCLGNLNELTQERSVTSLLNYMVFAAVITVTFYFVYLDVVDINYLNVLILIAFLVSVTNAIEQVVRQVKRKRIFPKRLDPFVSED
jgi:hypothetical protein